MSETEARIRAELENFWDERAIPVGPSGETAVEGLVAPVESMTAVDVLTGLDKIVGRQLPITVIRRGGYATREQFIELLTANVMKQLKEAV